MCIFALYEVGTDYGMWIGLFRNTHRGKKLSVLYSVNHNGAFGEAVGRYAIQRRYCCRSGDGHLKDDMVCSSAWP